MGDARRRAAAFAAELAAAYPSTQIQAGTLNAYAHAFTEVGLDIADDVSALLRVRSNWAPSVAQIFDAAREVRKETPSDEFSTWNCVFIDGVECPQCTRLNHQPTIHGHLLPPEEVAAKIQGLRVEGFFGDPDARADAEHERVSQLKVQTILENVDGVEVSVEEPCDRCNHTLRRHPLNLDRKPTDPECKVEGCICDGFVLRPRVKT